MNIEQERAKMAWDFIKRLSPEEKTKEKRDAFSKTCKRTAARILNSGLLPALQFLKEEDPLLHVLNRQLAANGRLAFLTGTGNDLWTRLLTANDPLSLRRATTEVLACLPWLARFADCEEDNNAPEPPNETEQGAEPCPIDPS